MARRLAALFLSKERNMSAFGNYKRSCASSSGSGSGSGGGSGSGSSFSAFAAYKPPREDSTGCKDTGARKKKKAAEVSDSEEDTLESFLPKEDSGDDEALAPLMSAGMGIAKKKPVHPPAKDLSTEDHDYVRDHCVVPSDCLKTFAQVHGAHVARKFAENYQPVSSGGTRAISGLLLFGPSGTGKSLLAQAITNYIDGTFYTLSAADLPNGKAGALRIDALFDVALAGEKPAVIFIDECDTMLSARAPARVGHFAKRFERFTDNLLVIGATNEPDNIAPKILTGRFERKIFVDNPNSSARRAMLRRQLSEEDNSHMLSAADIEFVVEATAGRSGVNMERLISSACTAAAGMPVGRDDFETALEAEPSDFDMRTAKTNAKYDEKHGWHPA